MNALFRLGVIVLFMLLTLDFAHAQLYKVDLSEKIQKASLIIEGKVIGKKSFWNDTHTMIFTANKIEVYKLFKGAIIEKTIELVTQGGTVGSKAVIVSDLLELDINKTGIFFCRPNENHLISPETGKLLFDVYSSDQGFLRYDEKEDIAYAPFAYYNGIEKNLHKQIQQKTGKAISIVAANYKVNRGNSSSVSSVVQGAIINSFSPTTIHAGALNDSENNILTINGSDFGNVPSERCAVNFKDGNSDNTDADYSISYNSAYMISWSNTKIVIRVPGRAATGKIAVVTSDGTITQSSSDLNVFYGVLNSTFDFSSEGVDTMVVTEPRLMNTNTSGGYTIRYSMSTEGDGKNLDTSPEKYTFQRAFSTWKEQVGVNFIEGPPTTVQAITSEDYINVIVFDNNNTGVPHLPAGVLATTYGWFSVCFTKSPFKVYNAQKTGFDMLVRNDGVSSGSTLFTVGPCFPTTDIDLEMVMLHELGHALNLAHINDGIESSNNNNSFFINPGKVMHYAIANYVNRRSLDVSAYLGGLYTVTKQNNSYGSCTLAATEMTPITNTTVIENDNCPLSFPSDETPDGTIVNFDLTHATSNKLTDPQFTAINCGEINGEFVTNNAFYAIKTSSVSNSLKIVIGNYKTTPPDQKSCAEQGVRLAVYDVNTCPEGQNYPDPIACRIFYGDTILPVITDLQSSHNYLLYFDGLRNTKANFDAVINGDSIIPHPEVALKVYPNPVKSNLTISLADTVRGKYQFFLYDILGKLVVSHTFDIVIGSQILTMPLPNMAKGIYILNVIDTKGNRVATQKIMKD